MSEPEALRLAQALEDGWCPDDSPSEMMLAAAELRRLHAANADCLAWYEAIKAEREADRAAMREAMEALTRCVKGIDRLAEIARKWKPEISFGADRQRIAQAEYAGNDARTAVEKLKARTS